MGGWLLNTSLLAVLCTIWRLAVFTLYDWRFKFLKYIATHQQVIFHHVCTMCAKPTYMERKNTPRIIIIWKNGWLHTFPMSSHTWNKRFLVLCQPSLTLTFIFFNPYIHTYIRVPQNNLTVRTNKKLLCKPQTLFSFKSYAIYTPGCDTPPRENIFLTSWAVSQSLSQSSVALINPYHMYLCVHTRPQKRFSPMPSHVTHTHYSYSFQQSLLTFWLFFIV